MLHYNNYCRYVIVNLKTNLIKWARAVKLSKCEKEKRKYKFSKELNIFYLLAPTLGLNKQINNTDLIFLRLKNIDKMF